MNFEIPDDCRFLDSHEWAREKNDHIRIGVSDFAQDELGDIVFVELPDEGDTVEHGVDFGVIESIKAVSDLYAPVSGTVVARNETLIDQPELANDDPYGDGWMLDIDPAEDSGFDELLSAEAYREQIE